jgi:hypothetical protein
VLEKDVSELNTEADWDCFRLMEPVGVGTSRPVFPTPSANGSFGRDDFGLTDRIEPVGVIGLLK